MNPFSIFENALYRIFDLFSCIILTLIPFRNHLRFSPSITFILSIILYLLRITISILSPNITISATILSILSTVFYIGFFIIIVRADLLKLLFVLLTIINYASFTSIFSIFFVSLFYPNHTLRPYDIHSTIFLAFTLCLTFPFVFLFMNKKIYPLMMLKEKIKLWNFLWLVPSIFYIVYCYVFFSAGGSIAFLQTWQNALFVFIINLASFLITYILVLLVEENVANLKLKTENYQLFMKSLQYENLTNKIDETRRIRHDLRQHIAVIQSFLETDNKEELKEYLRNYLNILPFFTPIVYCEDYTLNALIVYYSDLAHKNKISFTAHVQYSISANISELDVTVLFGNLLENAIEACIRQTSGDKFILLKVIPEGISSIIITLDNSYNGTILKKGNTLLSSKKKEIGIGIRSIQSIVEKYYGIVQFEYDNNVFRVSIFLNLNTKKNLTL